MLEFKAWQVAPAGLECKSNAAHSFKDPNVRQARNIAAQPVRFEYFRFIFVLREILVLCDELFNKYIDTVFLPLRIPLCPTAL